MLNFTWWLNRQDAEGNDLFSGGFLGLDNLSAFDRSHLPGRRPPRAVRRDGVDVRLLRCRCCAWPRRLRSAIRRTATSMTTFLEHAVRIAARDEPAAACGTRRTGSTTTPLRLPDGSSVPLQIHSMVGLLPILPAVAVPAAGRRAGRRRWASSSRGSSQNAGVSEARCAPRGSIVRGGRRRVDDPQPAAAGPPRAGPAEALSEDEFLSPHGLRALSRRHLDAPFQHHRRGRRPRRSTTSPASRRTTCSAATRTGAGPVWFPVNFLFIESLLRWDEGLGEAFTVEYPTGSGRRLRLRDVAADLARAAGVDLAARTRTATGRSQAAIAKLRDDPEWRDLLLFHEYFHGDTGAGIGASHQTGWTGLVAHLLCRGGTLDIAANGRPTHEPAPAGPPVPGGPVGVM